ncbi:MAG: mechanosensitive ion channel [Betaproteobacteria bacterium]|nr:mechanosensitive ion channel [Betaproteobacteria bacterium]
MRLFARLFLAIVALAGAGVLRAQAPEPAKPAGGAQASFSTIASTPATLKVYNRPIAEFRATLLGFQPAERVQRAQEVIRELLGAAGDGVVAVKSIPGGRAITVDDRSAFLVLEGDVNALTNETLDQAAKKAAAALKRVVEETRESRSFDALGRAGIAFAIATAILAAVIWLLVRVRGWIATRLAQLGSRHAQRLQVAGQALIGREQVFALARGLTTGFFWLLVGLAVYEWFGYGLARFPWTRPWGEGLQDATIAVGVTLAAGALGALPNLAIAVVIFMLAGALSSAVNTFMKPFIRGEVSTALLDRDTARPTRNIAIAFVWIFAIAMSYPYLPGSQSEAFKGLSVLIGLMISLGSTSIVGQAANGLILMFTRTVRPGEYVRMGDHEGTVMELGAFTTRIRTGLGEELTLSNSYVAGTVTRNYSRAVKGAGFVVDANVTIGYDTPWRQVEAMLVEAARRTPGILQDPTPVVFQTALSDFYPEYRLVAQAVPSEPRPRARVMSELHANIQDVFNEYGVQIMSPHYLGDPPQPVVVPKERWYAAPARPPQDS